MYSVVAHVFNLVLLFQEQFSRCFIEAWAVTENMMVDFKMPFVRVSGEYTIDSILCAYDEVNGKAEIFMELEKVRRGHLQNRLEQSGARHVMIHSFPNNDPNKLAEKFLHRVRERSTAPGMKMYKRGNSLLSPVAYLDSDGDGLYADLKRLQIEQDASIEEDVSIFIVRGTAVNYVLRYLKRNY